MKRKSGEASQLVDHLAKTAHEMVDRVHESATQMEKTIGTQSKQTGERIVTGIESEMSGFEDYIKENPMMAAAFAFGIGAFASRIFKVSMAPSEATPVESASSEEPKKASVSKKAA